MKYTENFLTANDCYRAGVPLAPKGIVVHSTGVNQKRISAYARQLNTSGVRKCVHGFLGLDDAGELTFEQHFPFGVRCWGVGSGTKGSFNASHLQFEICEDLPDEVWCRRTYTAALELCARLCREYGIDPEKVVSHSEAHALGYGSNHGDPVHWWSRYGLSMENFRKELKNLLEKLSYEDFQSHMSRYLAEQAAAGADSYAVEACRKAVASGVFTDGDGDGSLDRPKGLLLRQELATVLDRLGLLEKREEEKA